MVKRAVRRYLIIYHVLFPIAGGGATLLVLLVGLSFFFDGRLGLVLSTAGWLGFGCSLIVSLGVSAVIIWKTRNLE